MRGAIPPLPQYDFMAWCSVIEKHRDNFTFTLLFCVLVSHEPSDVFHCCCVLTVCFWSKFSVLWFPQTVGTHAALPVCGQASGLKLAQYCKLFLSLAWFHAS
jgi:hypothetical protein